MAIVPAAGCGARAALSGNKVLAPLCGKPLLFWTLRALAHSAARLAEANLQLTQILIAARREEFELIEPLITEYAPLVGVVEGGATRQQSVYHAARSANSQAEYFLVHDAARPLVSSELITDVCNSARQHGAAIAALGASDTVKQTVTENGVSFISSTVDRRTIYLAQTPQVFERKLFLSAFESAARDQFEGTDCASLVERYGGRVAIVEGEASNFKVTFAVDLERAEDALRKRIAQ